jgi:hypothetical protein
MPSCSTCNRGDSLAGSGLSAHKRHASCSTYREVNAKQLGCRERQADSRKRLRASSKGSNPHCSNLASQPVSGQAEPSVWTSRCVMPCGSTRTLSVLSSVGADEQLQMMDGGGCKAGQASRESHLNLCCDLHLPTSMFQSWLGCLRSIQ